MPRSEEFRLIARAKRGNADAFRALVEAYQDRLFAFVWRTVRNHHEAEDICQAAFIKAYEALHSYSEEYAFSTWLFTIAYRLCLNHIRRRKSLTGEVDFTGISSDEPDPVEQIAESEEARRLKDLIWGAVDELSAPQKAAIMLFYREGMSCDAIARTLGIPMATAKSHLHRARGRLRDTLSGLVKDWTSFRSLRETAS